MEVDSVLAHYIMLGAWIREVIYLHVVLDAFADEAEAVLPYDYRVDCSLTDEKLALEILRLVDEAGLCKSFRVSVRMVHVSFSIHDLIPFPVDYRASCNSHLEYVRVVCDERYGHESAIAPAVYSDTVLVDIRKVHEHIDSYHLVGHLCLSALSVDGLLELETTVLSTSVVLYIYEVSTLCHVHLPSAELAHICILDHLRMRTAVYINDNRVFLRRIEVLRLDETVPVVVLAVCTLYSAKADLGLCIVHGRILCSEQVSDCLAVSSAEIHHTWSRKVVPVVGEVCAVFIHCDCVPS